MAFDRLTKSQKHKVMLVFADVLIDTLNTYGMAEHLKICDEHNKAMLEYVEILAELMDECNETPNEEFVTWVLRTFESNRLLELWRDVVPDVPDENTVPNPLDEDQLRYMQKLWGYRF